MNVHPVTDSTLSTGASRADCAFTLKLSGLTAFDGSSNSVSFSSTAKSGAITSQAVTSGASYNTITATNTNSDGTTSTLSLAGGTASGNKNVVVKYAAPPANNGGTIVGGAADLTGTGSDLIVVKNTYDPATAIALFGSVNGIFLLWQNSITQQLQNAVSGNTGGTPTLISGGYDPANDFHLGFYGNDTTNNYVWAVVDHNSVFAAGQIAPTPEPTSILLFALGGAGLAMQRRRTRASA